MKIRYRLIAFSCLILLSLPGCGSDPIVPTPETYNYILTNLYFETAEPAYINVLFQVTGKDGRGISDLETSDFIVTEDSERVSPTESRMAIRKMDELPYTIKTVLLLDISPSVADQFATIKEAALSLIDQIVPQQEVAIYTFSSTVVLVEDFTSDKVDLREAIESINVPLGSYTTDLYGSIAETVQKWTDSFSLVDPLSQGFLVAITDGSDEAGYHTLEYALDSRGDKWIYTIGLGEEIDEDVLSEIGNRGFYAVTDINKLQDVFDNIQTDIVRYANSFYWLYYLSSRRDSGDHQLTMSVQDNSLTGDESRIQHVFNSGTFFDLPGGVLVNSDECNRPGLDELQLMTGTRAQLEVVSHWGDNTPMFTWQTNTAGIVTYQINPTDSIILTATGSAGESVTLTVTDIANLDQHIDFRRDINIDIVDQYEMGFESGNLPTYIRNCGDWTYNTTYVKDGLFSLGSSGIIGQNSSNIFYIDWPVPASTDIQIEFDIFEPGNDGDAYVQINGDNHNIDDNASNWLHRTYTYSTDADEEVIELSFIHNAGPLGLLCLDNIRVSVITK